MKFTLLIAALPRMAKELFAVHDFFTSQKNGSRPAGDFCAFIGGPAGCFAQVAGADSHFSIGVEDDDVGVVAGQQGAFARQAHAAGGAGTTGGHP